VPVGSPRPAAAPVSADDLGAALRGAGERRADGTRVRFGNGHA